MFPGWVSVDAPLAWLGSIPWGALGYFWVGMCHPGLKIGTPFYKKFALKLIPRSRNGPIFYTPF